MLITTNRLPKRQTDPVAAELSQLFDTVFSGFAPGRPGYPTLDAVDLGDAFALYLDVPGITLEALDLQLEDGRLTIKGTRTFDLPEGATGLRHERFSGDFERVLQLPTEVDSDNVTASAKDGVLTITLPKLKSAQPRKISVTTN